MKILVGLNNKNILDYLDYTKSFIIGLKDFSINYQEYSIEEIEELINNYSDIEIFISINKNIFNSDIKLLEDKLIKLDKLNIKGVLFYDLSILYIVKNNNLSIPLVWAQEHMTTNYNTCNYYYDRGCEYVYLSSEITLDEIKEIANKSKIKLISFLFGYPDVSFSKRKLISNYFLNSKKDKKRDYYEITSDKEKYYIKENNLGTRIIYGNILNGIRPFYELKDILSYTILSEEFINHETFIKVLEIYKDLQDNKIDLLKANEKIINLTGSNDTVFYYKKTIYKVKDNG